MRRERQRRDFCRYRITPHHQAQRRAGFGKSCCDITHAYRAVNGRAEAAAGDDTDSLAAFIRNGGILARQGAGFGLDAHPFPADAVFDLLLNFGSSDKAALLPPPLADGPQQIATKEDRVLEAFFVSRQS